MVSYITLASRIEAGWDLEKALASPSILSIRTHERQICAFGETKSVLEWACDPRACVPSRTILWRIQRGWQPESAISEPPPQKSEAVSKAHRASQIQYEAFGTKKTLKGWLQDPRCRLKKTQLLRCLAQGLNMEEALTAEVDGLNRKRAIVEKQFSNIDEALQAIKPGAELWQVHTSNGIRCSLLMGHTRYDVQPGIFEQLIQSTQVELVFKTPRIAEYRATRPMQTASV